MFKIIQNNNNTNKNVNENFTELPFLNHHITEFLCCGQHILLSRLWEKRLAHTLMVRIQNGTISVGSPRGMWKYLVILHMQISLDSILLFLEPNPKSSWTKIQNDSFKGLYTVMLLVQAKDRNKMKCPLSGKWLNKLFTEQNTKKLRKCIQKLFMHWYEKLYKKWVIKWWKQR